MKAAGQRSSSALFVIWIVSMVSVLPAGSNAREAVPMPKDSDWLAYKSVEAAIASAEKNPGKRVSKSDLEGWLTAKNWLTDGKHDYTFRRWQRNYWHEPYYAGNIKRFVESKYPIEGVSLPSVAKISDGAQPHIEAEPGPKITLRLRQSYSDVLGIEDPSQNVATNKKVDDLQGALASYSRDFKRHTDVWSVRAALLLPIVGQTGFQPNMREWGLISYGLVPSVSLYRVTGEPTSGSEKNVDQLTFRVGMFAKWSAPAGPLDTLTLRGFATYLTDTGFRSNIPAGQFEWEPQLFFSKYATVGYITQLLNKLPKQTPGNIDWKDASWLAYQLRLRLHLDWGDVSNSGRTGAPTGSFFRLGSIVDFQLKPLVDRRLSLGLSYQYLPALVGPTSRSGLFTVALEFDLLRPNETDPDSNQSVTIKATYTNGGVDLTRQKVDTFQLGLGATF
jgi:hypothetical protein